MSGLRIICNEYSEIFGRNLDFLAQFILVFWMPHEFGVIFYALFLRATKFMENTFGRNIIPLNEPERLQALRRLNILHTPPEASFDRIAKLSAQIFNTPIALISFVAEEEVFFKAAVGMGKTRYASRGVSLCSLAILSTEVTVFENPLEEPCLLSNPLVTGSFGLRFYAAAPLMVEGLMIGSVCIVDKKPRYFNEDQKHMLQQVAAVVMDQLEGRMAAQAVNEMMLS